MLERTDAITNKVLEPITFVLACPTIFRSIFHSTFHTASIQKIFRFSILHDCLVLPSEEQVNPTIITLF